MVRDDGWLGQYAPGTRASDGSPVVSLRSTTATSLQGPESFNSGARLLGKCSVITFAVSSSALVRAIPSLTISGGGEGSRPVGLREAGLPGRQAEVSGLVLPRAAAGRSRSSLAVRRSPAAAGCRPPVAQRRPGFPPASLRRPHTGASSPSAPSLADPRAARRNRPAEGWGVGS
jgi:hypothetical protein